MKKAKIDYPKIFYVGSIISIIVWIFLIIIFLFITHDTKLSLVCSITVTAILNIFYLFFAVRYAKNLDAVVETNDELYDFATSFSIGKSWQKTSNASKRAALIFVGSLILIIIIFSILDFLFA